MTAQAPHHRSRSNKRFRSGAVIPGHFAVVCLAFSPRACDKRFEFDEPAYELPNGMGSDAGSNSTSAFTPCQADDDCALTLHCDVLTGLCIDCVVDDDCTTQENAPYCDRALHRCVQCAGPSDCAEDQICDTVERRCLSRCDDRNECPANAHECDPRRHVCINCDSDAECRDASAAYCGLGGTACVECRTDEHCRDNHVCDALSGSCVECRDSLDCPNGSACDPVTRQCASN